VIDHFMYAVPSLDDGMDWAAETFDASPAYGGAHVGLGTRNALLSLGTTYLEIIAPDPEQELAENMGARLAALSKGGLVTWAARGNLGDIAAVLKAQHMTCRGPSRTERRTADGGLLVWELLFPVVHPFGPRMPFFIDWLDCPHPAETNPSGGAFAQLTLTLPEPRAFKAVLSALELNDQLEVHAGDPGVELSINTRRGPVTLSSNAETAGLTF